MKRVLLILTVIAALSAAVWAATPAKSKAKVYVYEVITAETTFQTVSKLQPDAFLYYNGGEDIIFSLKVLDVYPVEDFDKAVRDYGLEEKNVRFLPHITVPNDNISRRPYYWWR